MSNFLILPIPRLLYRFVHNISIFDKENLWNLANMCLKNMSMTVCHRICYLRFVTENKDTFLLDDHI